jgi:hypothetical protein
MTESTDYPGARVDHEGDIYRPRFLDVPITMFNPGAATAAVAGPSAPVEAVPLADLGWYDQWSAPIQANGGCPPLNRATTLVVDDNPDGTVNLAWTEYGRDMWYWIYQRDKTAGEPFEKFELWSVAPDALVQPVFRRDRNGHEFEWYVVPFSTGGPQDDRNGDGRPDNWAPAANTVSRRVTVQPPSAPAWAHYEPAGNGRARVWWAEVANPSNKVYYWVWSCDTPLLCDKFGPYNYDQSTAVVDDSMTICIWSVRRISEDGPGCPCHAQAC